MLFNLYEVSLILISFQCFLFATILWSGPGPKPRANFLLATLMTLLGVQMLVILFENRVYTFEEAQSYLCVFGFGYGPVLYLYTRSLIYRSYRFRKQDALHAIPLTIMLLSATFGVGLCSRFGSFLYVSLIIYSIFSFKEIVSYTKALIQTQSANGTITLSWLKWTLVLFVATFLIDIYQHFYQDIEVFQGVTLVNCSILILVNGMFYKGLKQPMIFQGITFEEMAVVTKSFASQEQSEEVEKKLEQIRRHMSECKPFVNPMLSLNDLALDLNVAPRELSGLINRHFNQNFIDFINTYRIEMAKDRLMNPQDEKETIIEVMYLVGFNSKSSFNTIFKKKTGLTPSEFKRSQGI